MNEAASTNETETRLAEELRRSLWIHIAAITATQIAWTLARWLTYLEFYYVDQVIYNVTLNSAIQFCTILIQFSALANHFYVVAHEKVKHSAYLILGGLLSANGGFLVSLGPHESPIDSFYYSSVLFGMWLGSWPLAATVRDMHFPFDRHAVELRRVEWRLRFSIRNLLFITTIVAVNCAFLRASLVHAPQNHLPLTFEYPILFLIGTTFGVVCMACGTIMVTFLLGPLWIIGLKDFARLRFWLVLIGLIAIVFVCFRPQFLPTTLLFFCALLWHVAAIYYLSRKRRADSGSL